MTQTNSKSVRLPCPAENLIIHRPPMLLIDTLIERKGDSAVATAVVENDNPCFSTKHGILPEFFIEIMAQAMAAANGYDALLDHAAPKDGFIVGLDNFTLTHIPADERNFEIRIMKTLEFGSMKVMEGVVISQDIIIARGELKVWEQASEKK